MTEEFVYKIRDKRTGLFSKGGSYATLHDPKDWSKRGKVWTSMAAVKLHLRQFIRSEWNSDYSVSKEINEIPERWEVVPIRVVYHESQALKARELIQTKE